MHREKESSTVGWKLYTIKFCAYTKYTNINKIALYFSNFLFTVKLI